MSLIVRRWYTSARLSPATQYLANRRSPAHEEGSSTTPVDLTQRERDTLDELSGIRVRNTVRLIKPRVLRVDHAGEVAANWIYKGQLAVLGKDRQTGPLIQEMWDQEKKHLSVMDELQKQHRTRPTALIEVAKIAGYGLGAVTALMGKEAAMACTEAVETVIGEHYDDQLKELDAFSTEHSSIPVLRDIIEELRDDELEHLDTAVTHFSQRAPAHALLSTVIGAGCKVAIEVCKRV